MVTGQSETPGQPPKASTQGQARSARMRNDTGGKHESVLLSSDVYRAEQATPSKAGSTSIAVNSHLAHSRKGNDQAVGTTAEAGQAMSTATYGRDNTSSPGGTAGSLKVRDIGAAHTTARPG